MTADTQVGAYYAYYYNGVPGQRQFRSHKVLPRPADLDHHHHHQHIPSFSDSDSSSCCSSPQQLPDLTLDTRQRGTAPAPGSTTPTAPSAPGSQPSSPPTLRHTARNLAAATISATRPQLPPTPPTHSRTSSGSHSHSHSLASASDASALPSSPTINDDIHHHLVPLPRSEAAKLSAYAPTTPPDQQRSPPTPDVTPPQPLTRPMALRPLTAVVDPGGAAPAPPSVDRDRPAPARRTVTDATIESRTESFRTAREDQTESSSEDDGHSSTVRPAVASGRTSSQATVRKIPSANGQRLPHPLALDMALSRLTSPVDDGRGERDDQDDDEDNDGTITPRTREELADFDGDWARDQVAVPKTRQPEPPTQRHQQQQQHYRQPQLQPQPRQQSHRKQMSRSAVQDAVPVAPSSAVQAVRHASLSGGKPSSQSSLQSANRVSRSASGPTYSRSSVAATSRPPSSALSSASFNKGSVFLGDPTIYGEQASRHRTLRHVRKQSALREPIDLRAAAASPAVPRRRPSPPAPAPATSTPPVVERGRRPSRPPVVNNHRPAPATNPAATADQPSKKDSYVSVNSVSNSRARREVWKSGGIPVIVVPDRLSSSRSKSREPSLRSTSSRRTQSVGRSREREQEVDRPKEQPRGRRGPVFERPGPKPPAHSRSYSLSSMNSSSTSRSGGDVRTIDYPPAIPARSSSLSAPTSRNVSRTGSMTTESLRNRDAQLQQQQQIKLEAALAPLAREDTTASTDKDVVSSASREFRESKEDDSPVLPPLPPPHLQQSFSSWTAPRRLASPLQLDLDPARLAADLEEGLASPFRAPTSTARATPFSVRSIDTIGTAPEVSQAQAVHMYHHQNSSLLMVDHSTRPSDVSENQRPAQPATPAKGQFSLDDIESPLRNPRAPPQPPTQTQAQAPTHTQEETQPPGSLLLPPRPPALMLTSATPSGLTPGTDRDVQRGNFFETMAEVPEEKRRRSRLLRQAFSRRRDSVSYPPNASRSRGGASLLTRTLSRGRRERTHRRSTSWSEGGYPQEDDGPPEEDRLHPFWRPQWLPYDDDEAIDDDDEDGEHLRYPPIDNRPGRPKRRLSDRVKKTFAVLPAQRGDMYLDESTGTERRVIQRTPSGNLRVMRGSSSSPVSGDERPSTAPTGTQHPPRSVSGFRAPPHWNLFSSTGGGSRSRSSSVGGGRRRRFSLGDRVEDLQDLPRRMSDRRREKRSAELRSRISGPREVRDGVEEMVRGRGRDGQRVG